MMPYRKRLSEIVREMPGARLAGMADPEITSVEFDSRRVGRGSLFVAIPGIQTDGSEYVRDAVAGGAAAIVLSRPLAEPLPVPQVHVPDAREALADAAWALYNHPELGLVAAGVTGTNGKTTTCALLKSLLEAAGTRTGLIGTLGVHYRGMVAESPRTTPESSDLARHFAAMRDEGCTHVVMEATSIGIDMKRLYGIPFRVAAFTNLTRDHLDYHCSEHAYLEAKLKLFRQLPPTSTAVVNIDDPAAATFTEAARGTVVAYSLERKADFSATDLQLASSSLTFRLQHPSGTSVVRAPLVGRFNIYNILAAVACGHTLGIPVALSVETLKTVSVVRGRAEVVPIPAPFTVVVDYAHTPDALEKVLTALRALSPARLITVVGAGGDRDSGKRPLMASAGARFSDLVILTSDNPRSEDPESIIDEMEMGLPPHAHRLREADRRKAIEAALAEAKRGDIVLIAGKGHETYQEVRGIRYPFDDRTVALEAYRSMTT